MILFFRGLVKMAPTNIQKWLSQYIKSQHILIHIYLISLDFHTYAHLPDWSYIGWRMTSLYSWNEVKHVQQTLNSSEHLCITQRGEKSLTDIQHIDLPNLELNKCCEILCKLHQLPFPWPSLLWIHNIRVGTYITFPGSNVSQKWL
jgi:hypothetical protein